VNDRGRLIMGFLAMYLHYSRDPDDPLSGFTASRLKQICVEQTICSAGRAEAMLVLMRLFGHVEPAPETGDRRLRLLQATEHLLSSFRQRWEVTLNAMSAILPEGRQATAVLHDDAFTRAFVRNAWNQFATGFRLVNFVPETALFADRNSGFMIMFSLLCAGGSADSFPPGKPVTISISALSRRFGVSRVHVRKLLRDAEDQKLIARDAGSEDRFVLLPRLRDAGLNFFCVMFLFVAQCARDALRDVGALQQAS
jgi:hypothetical protein